MQPKMELLSQELVGRVLDEAYQLMLNPGIKVQSAEARQLLAEAGAQVEAGSEIVKIPQKVVEQALATVPQVFTVYDRLGNPAVTYGGDIVQFDPGSSGVHALDPETLAHNASTANDLARVVKIADLLPQYDAQSTAIVCNEIPKEVGDLYRLYLVLLYSNKPIVTAVLGSRVAASVKAPRRPGMPVSRYTPRSRSSRRWRASGAVRAVVARGSTPAAPEASHA